MKRSLAFALLAAALLSPTAALANSIQPIVPQPITQPLPCPEPVMIGGEMQAPPDAPSWCAYAFEALPMEELQRAPQIDAATGIVIGSSVIETTMPVPMPRPHHHGSELGYEGLLLAIMSGIAGFLLGRDQGRRESAPRKATARKR